MKKMTKLVVLMVVMTMVISILTGCGGNSKTKAKSKDSEVVIGIPSVTESFNFYNTTNGYESYSMTQVYDSLVTKDAEGAIIPSLAEAYDVSEDGMVYTFHLRKDVNFSDGANFKAADVVFSMNQALVSSYTSWIYEPLVASCEAVDDYTVVINLKKGSIGFLDYLSNINYFAVLSENAVTKAGDTYGTTPETIVGTGAYVVTEWTAGSYVKYKANENYFLGEPSIKNVRLKAISDSNTAVIALKTGEIQAYFDNIPGVSYDSIKKEEDLKLVDYASTTYFEIIMNCQNGIFSDPTMREAVALAIDREDMMEVGAQGQGAICDYPDDRDGFTQGDPELDDVWYQQDIDAAKALVKDAGLEGKTVTIKTYADEPYPTLATILQDALNNIGLKAEVLQMDRSAFIDEALTKGDYEIGICRWAAGTKDMDELWYGSLHTDSIGSPGNWSWYSNSEMDNLLVQAAGETDSDARKEMYAKAINIFVKDIPQIPLYYPNGSRAYSSDLSIEDGLVEYDKLFNYSWTN
ncbi:MAG: ABC transporter substrate-binding protein [Lachnospiraceae bacterium]|nr:ABC transporter substrate-binding protein [Lachnospiraceae bacterium]